MRLAVEISADVRTVERWLADPKQVQGEEREFGGGLAWLVRGDEEGLARDGTLKVMAALEERGEHINWCVLGEP